MENKRLKTSFGVNPLAVLGVLLALCAPKDNLCANPYSDQWKIFRKGQIVVITKLTVKR
jgi:hypothetical protein